MFNYDDILLYCKTHHVFLKVYNLRDRITIAGNTAIAVSL